MKALISCLTAALLLLVDYCLAQKNLIDVPSGEIVEKGKTFFQQQLSFDRTSLNGSTILTYGTGNNFEIGLNVHQFISNVE
jgi:hypothetical protein